jgi:hypothetical protein
MKHLILLLACCAVILSSCKKTNTIASPNFADSNFYFHFNFNNADYNYSGYVLTGSNIVSLISQANDPSPANPHYLPNIAVVIHFPVYSNPTEDDILALKGKSIYFNAGEGENVLTPYIYFEYTPHDTTRTPPGWESQIDIKDSSYNFTITSISYISTYSDGSSFRHYYTITGTCKARMREEGSNIVALADLTGSFHLLAVIGN